MGVGSAVKSSVASDGSAVKPSVVPDGSPVKPGVAPDVDSGQDVRFANALLQGFKDEFVSREADAVKNRYVGQLGRQALIIGGGFTFAYILLAYVLTPFFPKVNITPDAAATYGSFLAMAGAACGGTWLSFSLRRVVLGFSDLANLEEDQLNPTGRLLFVVGLTWVIGLFLVSGIINISFGSQQQNVQSVIFAALLGAVCGISERALASVVSRRSDDLVGRVAGEKTPISPKVP
jgi:hypothetical protein